VSGLKSGSLYREAGVSILEFTFVFPIFLILFGAVIDVSRYLAVKALLTHGVQNAAALAAVVDGIDSSDRESTVFIQARSAVLDEALSPVKTFVSTESGSGMQYLNSAPEVRLPPVVTSVSTRQSFMREPIEVEMNATVHTFLPLFPTLRVRVMATAYREPRQIPTLPVRTDCNDHPHGSELYGTEACPCGTNAYWNFASGECNCYISLSGGIPITGDPELACHCPENYKLQPYSIGSVYAYCVCNITDANCGVGWRANTAQDVCDCVCDTAKGFVASGEDCVCPAGRVVNTNGECVCADACGANFVLNTSSCACGCYSPFVLAGDECRCPGGTHQSGEDCVCNEPDPPCEGGQVMNTDTCICECPDACPDGTYQDPVSCTCGCPSDSRVFDGTSCQCDPEITCDSPKMVDTSDEDCGCICPPRMTDDGSGGCQCSNPNEIIEEGACICPELQCPPNQHQSEGYCGCECNPGLIREDEYSVCQCINENHVIEGDGSCGCAEDPSICTGGRVLNPETCSCECPVGSSPDASGDCRCSAANHQIIGGACECVQPQCASNTYWDEASCSCLCRPDFTLGGSGSCTCTNTYKVDLGDGTCGCATSADSCAADRVFSDEVCACICPEGSNPDATGECECNEENYEVVNGQCECQQQACGDYEIWNEDLCKCVCSSGFSRSGDGSCQCTNTNHEVNAEGTCSCPNGSESCTGDHIFSEQTCECICPPGASADGGGECHCDAANYEIIGGTCECVEAACNSNETWNSGACSCVCGADFTSSAEGSCVCINSNYVDLGNGSCGCPSSSLICTGGSVFDSQTCQCACPTDAVWTGSECVCDDSKKEAVNGVCQCIVTAADCDANAVYDAATCSCTCNTGFVGDGQSCDCGSDLKEVSGSTCVCRSDLAPCGGSLLRDPTTCVCDTCPGDKIAVGSECVCPTGKEESPPGSDTCVCPSACASGAAQQSDCSCVCTNTSLTYTNYGCLREEQCLVNGVLICQVINSDGSCSQCAE